MDNSRSLEALYQDGTGMVSLPKKSYKASIEGYDGFDDILSVDLAKSEENLAFLDTFQMIEAKNAADKIKMCKKLSANYGTRSGIPTAAATSVESLCHMMSLEEAAKAEAAGVNTGNEKAADKPEPKEKKRGFFKIVFEGIRHFFEKIWELFKRLISNIANLFKGKPAETSGTGNVNLNANASTDSNTSSQSVNKNGLDKNLNFDYISDIMALNPKGLNTMGFDKFCGNYKKTGKVISEMSSKIANHGNGGKDNHDAKEYISKNALAVKIAISETMKVLNGTVKSEAGTDPLSRNGLATGTVDTKSLTKYLKDCEKAIKFEKPDPDDKEGKNSNAFGVIKALFGLNRDNGMAEVIKNSNGKNTQAVVNLVKSGSFTGDVYSGSKKFANDIQKALNELSEPHNKMVETCKAWESKINTYVEGKNHDTSDFWTELTLITGSLKVCTRFEQVVVNATAAVTSYFGKLKKLCDQVNNA